MISSSGSAGLEVKLICGSSAGPVTVDRGGDLRRAGGRLEVEDRDQVAGEGHSAAGEIEAPAEHLDPAAQQLEAADGHRVAGGAADAERTAELGVEAEAADDDRRAVGAGDGDVEAEPAAALHARRRQRGGAGLTGGTKPGAVLMCSTFSAVPPPNRSGSRISALAMSTRPAIVPVVRIGPESVSDAV